MKHPRFSRLFVCLLAFTAAVSLYVFASAASSGSCGESMTWTLSDEGLLTVTGTGVMHFENFHKDRWDRTVKTAVIGEGVTELEEYPFYGCTQLVSVSLPESLTRIGDSCFKECTSLTTINIPQGLREIGRYAFEDCTSLETLTLPDGIESIGQSGIPQQVKCFSSFGSSTAIELGRIYRSFWIQGSDFEFRYQNKGSGIGYSDPGLHLYRVGADLAVVDVPEGVERLDYYALDSCKDLKCLILPDSVTEFYPYILPDCRRDFYIKCNPGSDAEKAALEYGLQYDNGIKQVIGYKITDEKEKIKWILTNYIRSGMSEREKAKVLHNWLCNNACYDYTFTYYYSNGVLLYGHGVCQSYMLAYEKLLTAAGLANRNLTGYSTYSNEGHGWNLVRVDDQWYHVDVTWDDSDAENESYENPHVIGYGSTQYFLATDEKMRENHIWDTGISADNNSVGIYNDTGVVYHTGDAGKYRLDTKKMTATLIEGNKNRKKITIPDTVTENGKTCKVTAVGDGAFSGSGRITALVIGDNVKTIGNGAFSGCAGLKKISGGSGLVTIGTEAFDGCKALAAVTLGKKMKTIGEKAFNGCAELKEIRILGTALKEIGSKAFSGTPKKAIVTCPKAKVGAYTKLLRKAGLSKKAKVQAEE